MTVQELYEGLKGLVEHGCGMMEIVIADTKARERIIKPDHFATRGAVRAYKRGDAISLESERAGDLRV